MGYSLKHLGEDIPQKKTNNLFKKFTDYLQWLRVYSTFIGSTELSWVHSIFMVLLRVYCPFLGSLGGLQHFHGFHTWDLHRFPGFYGAFMVFALRVCSTFLGSLGVYSVSMVFTLGVYIAFMGSLGVYGTFMVFTLQVCSAFLGSLGVYSVYMVFILGGLNPGLMAPLTALLFYEPLADAWVFAC